MLSPDAAFTTTKSILIEWIGADQATSFIRANDG